MSQLPEQLLKSNMNIMPPMDQNINLINQVNRVPIPQFIQNPQNIPMNQNLQMAMPIQDNNKPQNMVDTSK